MWRMTTITRTRGVAALQLEQGTWSKGHMTAHPQIPLLLNRGVRTRVSGGSGYSMQPQYMEGQECASDNAFGAR